MCKRFVGSNPGQVITSDDLASLLNQAWPQSVSPVNAMIGFKKCSIYPLNPGEISDRQLGPSKVFVRSASDSQLTSKQFTHEQAELFQTRYEEGYDLHDPVYLTWLQIHHPDVCSDTVSSPGSLKTCAPASSVRTRSLTESDGSDALSEILSAKSKRHQAEKTRNKH